METMKERSKKLASLVWALSILLPASGLAWGWVEVASGDATRTYHDVVFLDENRGFIVGELNGQGLYMYTTNGGRTLADWSGTTYPSPLHRIFFLPADPNYGWIVGDGTTVLYTTDGGQSWNSFETTGITDSQLRGVFFTDSDTGWVASTTAFNGSIFYKPDAASSWQAELTGAGSSFNDIVFADGSNGWAVANGNCTNGCFYFSTGDGNWSSQPISTSFFYRLRLVGSTELWAVGDWDGSSAMLVWDGTNWSSQTHPLADLRDIDFAGTDSSDGWAVGAGAAIINRSGGGSWSTQAAPVSYDLEAVSAIDSNRAFAVGAQGTIIFRGCTEASECADGNECTDDICNAGVCENPVLTGTACTDDGNICTDDLCDGAGSCQHPANAAPCDDGLFCNGADTCSGGSCSLHDGDPCAGGPECADSCNETTDSCLLPAGTACSDDGNICTDDVCDGAGNCSHLNNTAPCDDGLWCTVDDVCSGGTCSGSPRDCSYLSGPCYFYSCNEDADACLQGEAKPAGTTCVPCGRCDGQGNCQPAGDRAGEACDDGDPCTGTGNCDVQGTCVIEGWCDEIVSGEQCSEPAATYQQGLPDCRLPADKVTVEVEVFPADLQPGGLVPVRLWLRNNPENSHSGQPWNKALFGLEVRLQLETGSAYLLGSARLNGSAQGLSEHVDLQQGQVFITIDSTLAGELPVVTGAERAPWYLDLYLEQGGFAGGDFTVVASGSCRAESGEVGCHSTDGRQLLSATVTARRLPGRYQATAPSDAPAGCSCGSPGQTAGGLALLAAAWLLVTVLRRRRSA